MKFTYQHTRYACYMAYISGAIINSFAPLLFVIFQKDFNISLMELSVIISANFAIQLVVDLICSKYVEKIGYRRTLIIALMMAVLGITFLGTLPKLIEPFLGIMTSVVFYAIGSGMLEVMVSPTIEALPSDTKTSDMSLLHSFYCWGCVFVIIISTLFFKLFGVRNWSYLCYLLATVPLVTMLLFFKVPIIPFGQDKESVKCGEILSNRMFRIFLIVMLCAGASEIAMGQWASYFAETGLGVSKTIGDLLGPCMFAVLMGISRVLFSKFGEKTDTFNVLLVSSVICVFGYVLSALSKNPIVSLAGCGIVGFGSAVMWPATLSLAAKHCAFGGMTLFGLLAMGGDIGCSIGPALVAKVSTHFSIFNSPLKAGLLCATVFPVVLMISVSILKVMSRQKSE